VGREGEDGEDEGEEGAKRKMEKEFRIGATGASDSLGKLDRIRLSKKAPVDFRYPVCFPDIHALRNSSLQCADRAGTDYLPRSLDPENIDNTCVAVCILLDFLLYYSSIYS
jgi:hypothetical protein